MAFPKTSSTRSRDNLKSRKMKKLLLVAAMAVIAVGFVISCSKPDKAGDISGKSQSGPYRTMSDTLSKIANVDEDGKFEITANFDDLKSSWEEWLLDSLSVVSDLKNFQILSGIDTGDNNSTYYFLQANDTSGRTVVVDLYLIGSSMYYLQAAKTISCKGCAYACSPDKVGKNWRCTPGCGTNCEKTETVNTKLISF